MQVSVRTCSLWGDLGKPLSYMVTLWNCMWALHMQCNGGEWGRAGLVFGSVFLKSQLVT